MQHLKSKHASDYQDIELEQEKKRKIDKNPSKEPSKQPTLQSIEQFQPYAIDFLDVRNWTPLWLI